MNPIHVIIMSACVKAHVCLGVHLARSVFACVQVSSLRNRGVSAIQVEGVLIHIGIRSFIWNLNKCLFLRGCPPLRVAR